ncbi:MAG TPA: FtsX-like permease family protein [Rhodanobacteraceae bacterium]
MSMPPILTALRKHKSGVVLISLQIALTLAIVCNAVFIIAHRIERVNRPTGLNESNLILVQQQWVGAPTGNDQASLDKLDSMQLADLAALRQLPGVTDVAPVNSLPLLQSAWQGAISLKPHIQIGDKSSYDRVAFYLTNQNGLKTLGLKLVAGRNFRPEDVTHASFRGVMQNSPVLMITQALAHKLFPQGKALGQTVYLDGKSQPSRVIGIVARMQTPNVGPVASTFAWSSAILPKRYNGFFSMYAVRTQPGQMHAVMKAIKPALYKVDPMRVMGDGDVQSFATIRAAAYQKDIGMAILMGVISLILIGVTGAGIVGLTSFWVGQRHKQIGVRRALGARKVDILRYFQTENLIIAGLGAVLGIVLAVGLNLVLMRHIAMQRLPIWVVLAGVVLVLILGQLAVFVPARRASRVSPASAVRSV